MKISILLDSLNVLEANVVYNCRMGQPYSLFQSMFV